MSHSVTRGRRGLALLRLLRAHLRPHRTDIWLILLLQAGQTLANLYLPTLNADVINDGVVPGDIGHILLVGSFMVAVSLGQMVCTIAAVYLGARTAMALGRDVRSAIFNRVQDFSAREVGQFGTASLVTRTTNDVQQIQMLMLMTFTMLISAPITCVAGIVLALGQDVPLSSVVVLGVVVLGSVVAFVVSRMRPLARQQQQRIDRNNRILREQIMGVRVIRAFVRDARERRRFAGANEELLDVSLGIGRLIAVMLPATMVVVNLSTVAVMWWGGYRIDSGSMEVGALVAFIGYLLLILTSVMMATVMFMMLPRAEAAAERVTEVLDTEPSVRPPTTPVSLPGDHAELELRAAEFRYPGAEEPVLRDVDLVARRGEVTAIVGSTGSGKSTLLGLVARLFDVTGGSVLIDGVDVREVAPDELTRTVGLVPQKPVLFSGTVASNLRYGNPGATDEELWHALEVAQARDFVEQLPGGLDSPIAAGGTNVSGGQRQRLTIARAIVHRPAIYLFDDSFSALDYATDAQLRAALAEEAADAIVVVVAQRVASIRHADRIVVLDEGRVVGTGTHDELMDTNETYREIVLSQLTEQEAA